MEMSKGSLKNSRNTGKGNGRKGFWLFQNMGAKIIALIFAAVLWLLVTNINDPLSYWQIPNVPVKLLHTNLITDNGQVYSVLDDSDVVPVVTVRANRSIIDSLESDNIIATADVENMTSLNTIEIKYYSTKYNGDIVEIDGSIDNVKLNIEEKKTTSLVLKTTTTGETSPGYQIGTVSPEQNQVRISGPESVVSRIVSAVANVDVSGATGNISTYSDIRLYDANDTQITDTENLTMNITSVKVSVTVLPISDVPISAQYSGRPADGYMLNGVLTVEPSAIELAGKSTILSTIQNIVIPQSVLDISGSTADFVKTINITEYLPEGTSFADSSFDGNVTVRIGIEAEASKTITANIPDISLNNVPEGYSADIISVSDGTRTVSATSGQHITFTFSGLAGDVEHISLRDVSPSVNVGEGVGATRILSGEDLSGTYSIPVTITVPDNVTETVSMTAYVRVTNMNPQETVSEEIAEDTEM